MSVELHLLILVLVMHQKWHTNDPTYKIFYSSNYHGDLL